MEQIQKRVKELEEVFRISSVIADESLSLPFRLQEATNAILKVVGAQTGSVMLVEGDELAVRAASNQRIVGFRKSLKESSISTDVIRTGRRNLARRIKGSHPEDGVSKYRTDFAVSLPLFADGAVIGVLNITDKTTADDFTPAELEFIEHFKRSIEIVLENMELKRKLGTAASWS